MIGDHPFSFEKVPKLFSHFFGMHEYTLPHSNTDDTWCFYLRSPNDIHQFESIISGIQEKRLDFKLPKIVFALHRFLEFENPDTYILWLKEYIAGRYPYEIIRNKDEYDLLLTQNHQEDAILKEAEIFTSIFGKSFNALPFFSDGCAWRKCAFCNIGKIGTLRARTR